MNTYKLQSPVEFGGKIYSELTLRDAKVRDLVAGDSVKGEVRKSAALLASVAGVPLAVIEDLNLADFANLTEAMSSFLGKQPSSTEESQ